MFSRTHTLTQMGTTRTAYSLATRCTPRQVWPWAPPSTPPTSLINAQRPPGHNTLPPSAFLAHIFFARPFGVYPTGPRWGRQVERWGLHPGALRVVHTPAHSGQGPMARADGRGITSNIKLNQDLVTAAKSSDNEQLCALVMARWQDFNAVNAATAYQKLLLMRTAPDAGDRRHSPRDAALAVLEPALRDLHIPVFDAHQCASTLHGLAKTRRRQPRADMVHADMAASRHAARP